MAYFNSLRVSLLFAGGAVVAHASGSLPLSFEPNQGQGARASQYLARGAGYTVGVRRDGAAISVRGRDGKGESTVLRLVGVSGASRLMAKDPLAGKVNYFIGSDPKRWHTDLPTFARVENQGAYPGIDINYYGTEGRLEFDFRVHPGGDSSRIVMKFEGLAGPRLDSNGDLLVGALRQHKPVAYQTVRGSERAAVPCYYVLRASGEVALSVGAYDHRLPLIIDPVVSYSTYIGGALNDSVTSIKTDASGNVYIAGFTSSANFPVRGAVQAAYAGTNSPLLQGQFGDAFVAKLNPSGTALLYATYLGGSGDDFATALAIDASGNAYVVGATQSSNFPVSTGAFQKTYLGFTAADNNGFYNPGDGFVVKLNPSGNALLYSTYLGGTLNDLPMGVAVDSAGDAIVVGATESTDFPTTASAIARQYRGNGNVGSAVAGDGFVTILNPTGTALTYSTFLGGRGHDAARGVAVDAQNNIYICGMTSSGDFPTTTGALLTTYLGNENTQDYNNPVGHGFVSKLSSQGALVYSTFLGGSLRDGAAAIAADGTGAAYVTGSTASTDFPTTAGAVQKSYQGRGTVGSFGDITFGDAFAVKLNPAGSALIYSTYLGGSGDDAGTDIAVDASGNAYLTGFTISNDFPVTSDALQPKNAGFGGQGLAANPSQGFDTERVRNTGDAFLVKLSASGSLTYSSFFGGSKDDAGLAIAVDAAGNPYVAGNTLSVGLAASTGAVQPSFGGMGSQWPRGDGFVVKFDFGGKVMAVPAAVSAVAGFPSSGSAGATLTPAFTVQVVDSQGTSIAGVTVAFQATGATLNPASAVTDAQGHASTVVTLGSSAGTATVTATVAGLQPVTANITITAATTGAAIKSVNISGSPASSGITQNAWVEIKGTNIVPANTPAAGVIWSTAPEFQQGKMPTQIGSVSVTINGKAAYVYYYCSAATSTVCASDQVNVLSPLDSTLGDVQIVVTSGGVSSAPATATMRAGVPSFFLFSAPYVVATHANGSLLGPATLYPGYSTPAAKNEPIVIYGTGFGLPSAALTAGSSTQGGSLPVLPVCQIGTDNAPVAFAGLIGPGLFQLNLTVPNTPATTGDRSINCSYNGASTPVADLITIQ